MDLNKPVFTLFPGAAKAIAGGLCPTCNKPVGEFKDELSKKEFGISGMCQKCQDSVFGDDSEGQQMIDREIASY